jgi:hypothetical protein
LAQDHHQNVAIKVIVSVLFVDDDLAGARAQKDASSRGLAATHGVVLFDLCHDFIPFAVELPGVTSHVVSS